MDVPWAELPQCQSDYVPRCCIGCQSTRSQEAGGCRCRRRSTERYRGRGGSQGGFCGRICGVRGICECAGGHHTFSSTPRFAQRCFDPRRAHRIVEPLGAYQRCKGSSKSCDGVCYNRQNSGQTRRRPTSGPPSKNPKTATHHGGHGARGVFERTKRKDLRPETNDVRGGEGRGGKRGRINILPRIFHEHEQEPWPRRRLVMSLSGGALRPTGG